MDYRDESSNFREDKNLMHCLEYMARTGLINDAEVFAFSDNDVFEGCFYKGHTHSQKLNGIILLL